MDLPGPHKYWSALTLSPPKSLNSFFYNQHYFVGVTHGLRKNYYPTCTIFIILKLLLLVTWDNKWYYVFKPYQHIRLDVTYRQYSGRGMWHVICTPVLLISNDYTDRNNNQLWEINYVMLWAQTWLYLCCIKTCANCDGVWKRRVQS